MRNIQTQMKWEWGSTEDRAKQGWGRGGRKNCLRQSTNQCWNFSKSSHHSSWPVTILSPKWRHTKKSFQRKKKKEDRVWGFKWCFDRRTIIIRRSVSNCQMVNTALRSGHWSILTVTKNTNFRASRMMTTTLHTSHMPVQLVFLPAPVNFMYMNCRQPVRNEHFGRDFRTFRLNVHSTHFFSFSRH